MDTSDLYIYMPLLVGCLLYIFLFFQFLRPAHKEQSLNTCEYFFHFICFAVVVVSIALFIDGQTLLSALVCLGGAFLAGIGYAVPLLCNNRDLKTVQAAQAKSTTAYW